MSVLVSKLIKKEVESEKSIANIFHDYRSSIYSDQDLLSNIGVENGKCNLVSLFVGNRVGKNEVLKRYIISNWKRQ